MTNLIEDNLAKAGIALPPAEAPVANYQSYVRVGNLLFVSGQVSKLNGALITGTVGKNISVDEATHAARCCGIALLSQVLDACGGDWSKLDRLVKLTAFVNCETPFGDQPKIVNGCSDLMVQILGEQGNHSRSAVGAPLPFNAAVEIEAIFQLV